MGHVRAASGEPLFAERRYQASVGSCFDGGDEAADDVVHHVRGVPARTTGRPTRAAAAAMAAEAGRTATSIASSSAGVMVASLGAW